jgi:hypothetical protein
MEVEYKTLLSLNLLFYFIYINTYYAKSIFYV